ncbi:DNA polymerase III subunit gamma/tau [Thiomicrorhabdus sp. Kp2]|uniref:DNA polymerase III subunit gamma/tau n=1 Tax=Thiomicrorhabdus sp. Kp2 TaxID=1123518 RepID=UPI0004089DCA|nr:DNA polymerase III subunit gamma/tau [Thiomicrorhabdus sp. Kp2]
MSYTVLARKWRPKSFSELVGQSHVMQALSNALDQQRLHHAYLFTGTRGVGKTTIARIFAKALNCQEGISSQPCGVCETCRSIDEGRFIDLIEVDAASKTKVDDTREILDNVQFAPTQGRYKVYLIDEVHMLSKSSFNALLKTLEEPPEHVKFLLATTDPHKLPITVLSRCLQFNLMRLTQPQIQNHLAYILTQENIPFEDSALALIAKSADGSARDSLSLLDQAIAYGAGQVMFEPVQTMLGLVDQQFGVAILSALAEEDSQQVKNTIQQLATMGVDYQALLAQLIESLHAISYVQVFGDNETTTLLPAEIVQNFAQSFAPERVQLLYQIALLTKQDMQLAPDIRIGFEMALMRMLAFVPAQSVNSESLQGTQGAVVNRVAKQTESDAGSAVSQNNPLDALAGLATARSLVGKKKPEITENSPIESNAENLTVIAGGDNQQTCSESEEAIEQSNPIQVTNRITEPEKHYSEDLNLNQDAPSPQPQASADQNQQPISEMPTHTDHLAQIRERLKQPLGKAGVTVKPVEPTEVPEESVTTALSHMLDHVQDQVESLPVSEPGLQESFNESVDLSMFEAQEASQSSLNHQDYASNEMNAIEDAPPWILEDSQTYAEDTAEKIQEHNQEHIQESLVQSNSMENNAVQVAESEERPSFEASDDLLADWIKLIERLDLKGMAADLARNSVLVELSERRLAISIDPEQHYAKPEMYLEQIAQAAKSLLGADVELDLVEADSFFTPVKYDAQQESNKMAAAENSINTDSVVQQLVSTLGMDIIPGSIKPI